MDPNKLRIENSIFVIPVTDQKYLQLVECTDVKGPLQSQKLNVDFGLCRMAVPNPCAVQTSIIISCVSTE